MDVATCLAWTRSSSTARPVSTPTRRRALASMASTAPSSARPSRTSFSRPSKSSCPLSIPPSPLAQVRPPPRPRLPMPALPPRPYPLHLTHHPAGIPTANSPQRAALASTFRASMASRCPSERGADRGCSGCASDRDQTLRRPSWIGWTTMGDGERVKGRPSHRLMRRPRRRERASLIRRDRVRRRRRGSCRLHRSVNEDCRCPSGRRRRIT